MSDASKIDDGGAAFAQHDHDAWNRSRVQGGLTKRDYFAAAALMGLLASSSYNDTHESDAAHDALGYADALIAASKSSEPSMEGT